jgi:hypothetical protein
MIRNDIDINWLHEITTDKMKVVDFVDTAEITMYQNSSAP